jgi:hypothetical protein
MHEELENLVNNLLAKGEITERSRELLIKKAEQLGVDAIDFELEIEGRIAETKIEKIAPPPPPNSNKEGTIKKCPACGAVAESFSTKCKDCGHEFRNISSSIVMQKLNEDFAKIELDVREEYFKNGRDVNVFPGGSFLVKNEKRIPKPTVQVDREIEATCNERKIALINIYPIPNTKEDIVEILSISIPEAKKKFGRYDPHDRKNMQKAWLAKSEQIIIKARIAMKDDKKTLEEIEGYAKQLGI